MENLYISDYKEWSIAEDIALKERLGFEAQYFSCSHNVMNYETRNPLKLSNDISNLSLHGPYDGLNPGSDDPVVTEKTKTVYNKFYSIAKSLNSKHLIFHSGYHPEKSDRNGWLNRSIVFWKDFIDNKNDEIAIHIENVYEKDFTLLKKMLDNICSSKVTACLDIGHAHCNSNISVESWVEGLKGMIGSVHIHNNYGDIDEHLGIDNGTVDMFNVLTLINKYAPLAQWTLETKEKKLSYDWLRNNNFIN